MYLLEPHLISINLVIDWDLEFNFWKSQINAYLIWFNILFYLAGVELLNFMYHDNALSLKVTSNCEIFIALS